MEKRKVVLMKNLTKILCFYKQILQSHLRFYQPEVPLKIQDYAETQNMLIIEFNAHN